ncbi:MAG: phospholipase effector Tle1 domain-containing protein [Saezia sp.]
MNGFVNSADIEGLGEGIGNDTIDSQVDIELKELTVNVFFDGTGNNMFNTKARLDKEHNHLSGQTSYENFYSNIALLYQGAEKSGESMASIYIEGAGTLQYEEDKTSGMAFAHKETGIQARVKEAFDRLDKLRSKYEAKILILNVFGFSRGSFYARYFCAKAKTRHRTKDEVEAWEMAVAHGGKKPDDWGVREALHLPPDQEPVPKFVYA